MTMYHHTSSKSCKKGLISVEDIQTALLIASLPESFTSVTSPFEQREDAWFNNVSKAVKGHVVTRKNRANQSSAATSSTANAATTDTPDSQSNTSKLKGKGKRRSNKPSADTYQGPGPCTHCKGKYHDVSTCLQKKSEDLDNLIRQMSSGKTNLACESDSNSDFSESMARSATSTQHTSNKRIRRLNVDLGTSDTLILSWSLLENPKPSSLVVQTADNTKIKANLSGRLPLNIPHFPQVTAHQVPGLANPSSRCRT